MYDEASRIGATLRTIAASELAGAGLEVVLVDDGSQDGTPEVAAAAAADAGLRAHVIELPANRGKGAAVRAGILSARAPVRVFVDADLSVEVEDVVRCFRTLEEGTAHVVYGTRAHRESALTRSQPVHRVAAGRTYNLLLRSLGLTAERDTQCGLKGFSAAAAADVFEPLRTAGFGFDIEVLARAARGGWRVEPLPVRWSHVAASRVRPLRDGWSMGWSALRIAGRLARETHPVVDGARTARTAQ